MIDYNETIKLLDKLIKRRKNGKKITKICKELDELKEKSFINKQ